VVFGLKFDYRMTTGLVVGLQILAETFFKDFPHTLSPPHQARFPFEFSAAVETAAKHCEQG
jgi:hypothetical protein